MSVPRSTPAFASRRHNLRRVLASALLVATLTGAAAEAGDFDPRQHRHFAGPASEVMVLGTPHLSELPKDFDPAHLAPVLDRLAAWKPSIITIEALSGPQCDFLRRYAAIYPGVADFYCWDPAPARIATGLDAPAAAAEVAKRLREWPAQPSPAQRRSLAAVFLAANDST